MIEKKEIIKSKGRKAKVLLLIGLVLLITPCLGLRNTLHPDFEIINIRPNSFQPKATGIDFLSDGKMLVTVSDLKQGSHSYNDDAQIYLLSGVEGTDNSSVTSSIYAQGYKDIMGIAVNKDTVYIVHRDEVVELVDNNGDGTSDGKRIVFNDWVKGDRMWNYGPAYYQGNLYVALSVNHSNTGGYGDNSKSQYRGCILKISMAGQVEIIAGGIRQPNGINVNRVGEVFVTDNQGQWTPHNKFIHIESGKFYGHDDTPFQPVGSNLPQEAPAIWLVQGEMNQSPGHPEFITQGMYSGQFMFGDVTSGGIRRAFIEKVNGKYQGVVMDFGNGYEVGINEVREAANGDLFVGGLGDGSNAGWGHAGTTYGLQKVVRKTTDVFELLAVRSLANGFELEFTKPVGTEASQTSNYTLSRFGVAPQSGYGAGAREGTRTLSIQSINLSLDKKKVTLVLNAADLQHGVGLMPSTIFSFDVANLKSETGDSIWTEKVFYTLNNIGPADILGCMNQRFQEYNAAAQYDDGLQCKTPSTPVEFQRNDYKKNINVVTGGKFLNILLPQMVDGDLELLDTRGRKVKFLNFQQQTNLKVIKDFPQGLYFLKVRINDFQFNKKILVD